MNGKISELAETVAQQLSAFTELDAILQDEHRALLNQDREALNQCLVRRAPVLAQIESLDDRVAACLRTLRVEPSRAGVEQCFANLSPVPRQRAQSVFAALREVAERCRKQNEINGKVIVHRQRNADRVLRILSGNTSPGSATYAPDGRVAAQSLPRTIATV